MDPPPHARVLGTRETAGLVGFVTPEKLATPRSVERGNPGAA